LKVAPGVATPLKINIKTRHLKKPCSSLKTTVFRDATVPVFRDYLQRNGQHTPNNCDREAKAVCKGKHLFMRGWNKPHAREVLIESKNTLLCLSSVGGSRGKVFKLFLDHLGASKRSFQQEQAGRQ
jgi:hypothetical protein